MKEDEFVVQSQHVIGTILHPPLLVKRAAVLLYQTYLDNRLQVQPRNFRHPARGDSAFQTDLCIFEQSEPDIAIPRVVLEFKMRLTTHDMLTYSAKARRHKQVYPYLRYGLVTADLLIPGRFFTHNEALDFGIAAGSYVGGSEGMLDLLKPIVKAEIDASRRPETIAFGKGQITVFRSEVLVIHPSSAESVSVSGR